MTSKPDLTAFRHRFECLFGRMRRVRLGTALCVAAMAVSLGIAILAASDYRWEFTLGVRQVLLALMIAGIGVALVRSAWTICRRWSRPTTAAELEGRFPELGQRVRTTLQYGGETSETIAAEGVTPTLVHALAADTDRRTRPLALDVVVPARRFRIAAGMGVAALGGLLLSAVIDREWCTAVRRALLADMPYTTLAVQPGSISVTEGAHLNVRLELTGRTQRTVVLLTRAAHDAGVGWSEETLDSTGGDRTEAPKHTRALETRLTRISAPIDYRVVVSSLRGKVVAESPIYRVAVRYPLAIQAVETTVIMPEYTGLGPKPLRDGSVTALRGSRARFQVTLDRAPAKAALHLTPKAAASDGPRLIPVQLAGSVVTAELALDEDFDWSLAAESVDGTPLPANAFRVRVHDDRAPQISFSEPDDALEVHTLAEILMQIRASDDYGLSRTGIVFQVNNDEEHTLVAEDFAEAARAATELAQTEQITQRTRATLERVLPLEHFALTQKDCVVYYAFAEDNFPGSPHRSETDLRFIDIRPFKTAYRLLEPSVEMPAAKGPKIASLEELIRRQRYALNRTIRLEKFPDRWGDSELSSIDRLIEYETELAQGTRDLAQFLEFRGNDIADVLFQAEAAMLGAVDSLSISQYETSVLQEKDAQQRLVEARERLEIAISKDPGLASALRQIDRRITQKLRRPRTEEDEKRRERVVQRLVQIAMNETSVAKSLANMNDASGEGAQADATDVAPPNAEKPQIAANSDDTGPARSNLDELQDRQSDIATEANELARILDSYEEVTELAKERLKTGAAAADTASSDLGRRDTDAAASGTRQAAEQFREVARHVAALLAGETPQQIAAARDIAAELAYRSQELATELETQNAPYRGTTRTTPEQTEKPQLDPAGIHASDAAIRIREAARTLQDIMKAIATTKNSTSAEAVDRVAELLERGDVSAAIHMIDRLTHQIAEKQPPQETVLDVREAGDRMETTARELDRLYRNLVMPRIEQVKEMERQVAQVIEQMLKLGSMTQLRDWERGAAELVEKLEEAGVGGGARDRAKELLAGGAQAAGAGWAVSDRGFMLPPGHYTTTFQLLLESVQQHIQELLLADLKASGDESVPPGFEALVQRYMQVLTNEVNHK